MGNTDPSVHIFLLLQVETRIKVFCASEHYLSFAYTTLHTPKNPYSYRPQLCLPLLNHPHPTQWPLGHPLPHQNLQLLHILESPKKRMESQQRLEDRWKTCIDPYLKGGCARMTPKRTTNSSSIPRKIRQNRTGNILSIYLMWSGVSAPKSAKDYKTKKTR